MVFEHYLSAAFITSIVILLYTIYHIIVYTKVGDWVYRKFAGRINESVFRAVFFRLSGFVLFGLVTAFVFSKIYGAELDFLTVQSHYFDGVILLSFALALLTITITYINVKNCKQNPYPQFKIDNWTNPYKFLSYITWILYLIGYEFMFRGVLLFGTIEEIGYYPAIILNVGLYAFVHIPKGKKEVLGCFIMGPILCILAIKTYSILLPVILHLSLCLSNEYFSIRTEIFNRRRVSSSY